MIMFLVNLRYCIFQVLQLELLFSLTGVIEADVEGRSGKPRLVLLFLE